MIMKLLNSKVAFSLDANRETNPICEKCGKYYLRSDYRGHSKEGTWTAMPSADITWCLGTSIPACVPRHETIDQSATDQTPLAPLIFP